MTMIRALDRSISEGGILLWGRGGIRYHEWRDRLLYDSEVDTVLYRLIYTPWRIGGTLLRVSNASLFRDQKYQRVVEYLSQYVLGVKASFDQLNTSYYQWDYSDIETIEQNLVIPGSYGWLEHAPLPEGLHAWLKDRARDIYLQSCEY